ncbi:MAG: hypothetical protein Q4C86_08465 [bacterium]|nr:hypothetical protein [bacterium]
MMKKQTLAISLAISLMLSAAAFAATSTTPVTAPAANTAPANTAAATEPSAVPAPSAEPASQVPATVSTGTQNTIVKPMSAAPAFQTLERIETIVYGNPRDGGLLNRLNDVEKTVFGRELPGSLTERQTALIDFLEKGTGTQPSLLFKLSVAEWGIEQQIHPTWSLSKRVDSMEGILEGAIQTGPLVSRVERLLTKLLPDGIAAVQFDLPKETIVKAALLDTLTVRNVKVDDIIILGLNEQIVVGDVLVAPKGSRVFGHITKVKPPRSFGRAAVIEMQIDSVEVLGPSVVPVNLGEAAKKAMDVDSGVIGAAGASFGGALLLGPVGLAGGFLIRGNDKQLKEGTAFYVQTVDNAAVQGYKIPQQITPITQTEGSAPQGTQSVPSN